MSFKNFICRRGGLTEAFVVIWPLMLSQAVSAVMQFTDRVFLAQYNDIAMRAALPAGLLSYLLLCVPQVTIGYSGTFVAQFFGAKKHVSCARALTQSVWLTLFVIPVELLMLPLGHFLLGVSGHEAVVIKQEFIYFDIVTYGGLLLPFAAAASGYFSGRGMTRLVMIYSVIASVVNIFLDYVLIFGHFGAPVLGIAGAAWATAFSFVSFAALLAISAFKESVFRGYRGAVAFKIDWSLMWRILRFGTPSAIHIVIDMLTFTFFVFVTGNLSALEFQVSNVVFSINHLIFAPLLGIGMGASIVVGNYQGAKESAVAKTAGWSSMAIGWIYMLTCCLIIGVFAKPILLLFLPETSEFTETAFISLGIKLIVIMLSWGMFDVMNCIIGGSLKGAGDTKFVMSAGVIACLVIWMPMVWWVWEHARLIQNLWLTMPLYIIILSLILLFRWIRGKWVDIKLIKVSDPV